MLNQYSVRYGRNYKVVLAIVLPGLLVWPFILLMQGYQSQKEWMIWIIIFAFLGFIISLSVWLALRAYPVTVLSINKNEISLSFDSSNFFTPADFSFNVEDITTFLQGNIGGAEYYIFKTRNPSRKFQVSSLSNNEDDLLYFNEAMFEISKMINRESR